MAPEPKNGGNGSEHKKDDLMEIKCQEEKKLKDNTAEIQTSNIGAKVPPKRGRPRKGSQPTVACPQRMGTLRNRSTVRSWKQRFQPDTRSVQDKSRKPGSLKPLRIKDSRPRILHTSKPKQPSKRKLNMEPVCDVPSKRRWVQKHKPVMKVKMKCKVKTDEERDCNTVDFRNPVKLKLVKDVKIVVDKTFCDRELSLKQLQELKPLVVIKKLICS